MLQAGLAWGSHSSSIWRPHIWSLGVNLSQSGELFPSSLANGMQQGSLLHLAKRLHFQQLLLEMKLSFSSTNPLSSSPDPMQAIPRSAPRIKTTAVVLFKVGLNENRRGGMCPAEEEPALGHPGAAGWTGTLGAAEPRPAASSAPRKGMWNPPPAHSGAIFGGMKLSRTFSFPLLGGSGIGEGFLLLEGF